MSFVADICGQDSEEEKPPKHAHDFGDVGKFQKMVHEERVKALSAFNTEVKNNNFPYQETNISMHPGENEKFLESVEKWTPVHQ